MSRDSIEYSDFQPDWWNTVGVPADAIAKSIKDILDNSFGGDVNELTR